MRYTLTFFLSLIVIVAAPFIGQIALHKAAILQPGSLDYQIFWDIRLPRVLLAFLTGGVLSLGGLLFQTIFRNELATPYTLGLSSAATLFVAIAIVLQLQQFGVLFAFAGAMISIGMLLTADMRNTQSDTTTLLLLGIAFSFFYAAALMLVYYTSDMQENYEILRFTMGSLDIVGYDDLRYLVVAAILLLLVAFQMRRSIRLLLTSYEFAVLKGIAIKRTIYLLLAVVSLAVGSAVSLTGPIGFVGLVVPHIVKRFYRQSAEKLLWQSFYYGGAFLVACDLFARNTRSPADIPIGVVTAFIGAPFFIYLLLRRGR